MENKKQNEHDKLSIQNLINKKKLQILELMKLNKSNKSDKSDKSDNTRDDELCKVIDSVDTISIETFYKTQKKIFGSTCDSNPDNNDKYNKLMNDVRYTLTSSTWTTSADSYQANDTNNINKSHDFLCSSYSNSDNKIGNTLKPSTWTTSSDPYQANDTNNINKSHDFLCSSYYSSSFSKSDNAHKTNKLSTNNVLSNVMCSSYSGSETSLFSSQTFGRSIRQSSHESVINIQKEEHAITDITELTEIAFPHDNIHNYPITRIGEKLYISKPNTPMHIDNSTVDKALVYDTSSCDSNVSMIKQNVIDDSIPDCSKEIDWDNLHIEI